MEEAHLRAPKYSQMLREIDGGSRRVCVITATTALNSQHQFRGDDVIHSRHEGPACAEIRGGCPPVIMGEKATARADGSRGWRRSAGHFTRRMMEQLREGKTPGPWRLITADRGVKFSRSIPSRCCCYCWSASSILFVEKGGQPTQTSAI